MPPPTGIAPAAPSTTSLAAGACFGAALLGMGPVAAGPAEGPMAMADGTAAPCGATPASSAPYGTAAVLQPASVRPSPPDQPRRAAPRAGSAGTPPAER